MLAVVSVFLLIAIVDYVRQWRQNHSQKVDSEKVDSDRIFWVRLILVAVNRTKGPNDEKA